MVDLKDHQETRFALHLVYPDFCHWLMLASGLLGLETVCHQKMRWAGRSPWAVLQHES
jgi:hypothetical protein